MIIVKVFGGLGNQLFQYSLGRALSLRHDTELFLDFSFFEEGKCIHPLSIVKFRVNYKTVTQKEYDFVSKKDKGFLLWKLNNQVQKILPYYKKNHVIEKSSCFDKNILNAKNNIILNGYWQSPKYFDEIAGVIKNDLQFKDAVKNPKFDEIKYVLQSNTSVVVNARRGDYLTLKVPLCTSEYYQQAMKLLEQKEKNPLYVVFSDDIEWCKEHIKTEKEIMFVEHSYGLHDYERMILMSYARHHIIVNSTFGWWGAWLNSNTDKIVIYPELAIRTLNKDLIPGGWICI